jgi:hypothetical protein
MVPSRRKGTIEIALRFIERWILELDVTRREYYVNRAAECLLASEQIPTDREVLLHMAATYIGIAIESELHEPRGPKISVSIGQNEAVQISN